jgi:hypothetical protein
MKRLSQLLKIVVPVSFVLGASMELFMIKTGFYSIVTKKEAERRLEFQLEEERKLKRMRELNIKLADDTGRKQP